MSSRARPRPRARIHTRRRLGVVVALVAAVLGFLLWRGLDDATVYFRTADEALAQRDALGSRRFRVEGVVSDDFGVHERGGVTSFVITENGADVAVAHQGDPPELFQPGIPVVLEGRWQGDRFASDRIMVRHTSEYREANPERFEGKRTPAPAPEAP